MKSIADRILIGLAMWLFAGGANAISLGLTPTFPDIVSFNADYSYDYVDSGNPANLGGTFTVIGSLLALNPDGSGNIGISGGDYSLTANFGLDGLFVDGSVTVLGSTIDPAFQSGTLLTADLSAMGFSGIDQAGSIEFELTNIGGDMLAFGDAGGVIISITDMLDGFASYSGNWDPLSDNNPAFWQRDFSGTADVDTFVPVPAAVWLFGSGLAGLLATARIRRSKRET